MWSSVLQADLRSSKWLLSSFQDSEVWCSWGHGIPVIAVADTELMAVIVIAIPRELHGSRKWSSAGHQ